MAATKPRKKTRGERRGAERTCIACRQPRAKHDLIRVVRTPPGAVVLDPTGKLSGRGAYLCADEACWEKGLTGATLTKHLNLTNGLSAEEQGRLLHEGLALVRGATGGLAARRS